MPAIPRLRDLPDVLTAKQVAQVLRISEWHAYDLAAKGKLPCIRLSRQCVRFPKRGIQELLGIEPGTENPPGAGTPGGQ